MSEKLKTRKYIYEGGTKFIQKTGSNENIAEFYPTGWACRKAYPIESATGENENVKAKKIPTAEEILQQTAVAKKKEQTY